MLTLGILFIFAGYSVGSWGYCLVKGYDIPLREWLSPLHPYQWPKSGSPPLIPSTQVFPGTASSSASSSSDSSTSSAPANPGDPALLRKHDRPPVQ